MWTKRKFLIKVALFLTAAVLVTGCSGKKCVTDMDCGGGYCSNNLQKSVSQACVKGRCIKNTTECSDSEICVADSFGPKCLPKDPATNLAIMSCGNNTDNTNILGFNQFNTTGYTCSDDCPKDTFCNDACYCEKMEEISCFGNMTDQMISGANSFNVRTNICTEDCPGAFECNADCLCQQRSPEECPDPEFTNNYFDPPPVTFDYSEILDLLNEDPMVFLLTYDTVNIPAYEHHRDGTIHYIPFPDWTLFRIENSEYIAQYGAYCVNDYFDGDNALTIDGTLLSMPEQTCIWGGTEGFEGVLTVCIEDLIKWGTTEW